MPTADPGPRKNKTYPIFHAFGPAAQRLTKEEEAAADVGVRIKLIWAFVVQAVMNFHGTLNHREKANYDPEDIASAIAVALMEKDPKWESGRSRYMTFASKIIMTELYMIRDLSRTVHSPRNSCCRLKEYEALQTAGSLKVGQAHTFGDIRRTVAQACTATEADLVQLDIDPERQEAEAERLEAISNQVAGALMMLFPFEALVIGKHFGLWGQEPRTIPELAEEFGRPQADIRRARKSGLAKIRGSVVHGIGAKTMLVDCEPEE